MAKLSAADRKRLPDRAFAYVDLAGVRRLPIMDAAHVRNALARFGQVEFEDERARAQARDRLLRAAKRFKIVPIGFISSEIESARAAVPDAAVLPTGFVTMLMTDIEGSSSLLAVLGDGYADLLADVREIQRSAVLAVGGCAVEARADEFFAAFESPAAAVTAAIDAHHRLAAASISGQHRVRIRTGIHAGYPKLAKPNYAGMAVHVTARICDVAHGGQIVVSEDLTTALTGMRPSGVRFRKLGVQRLRGIPGNVLLSQVMSPGLPTKFPPLRT